MGIRLWNNATGNGIRIYSASNSKSIIASYAYNGANTQGLELQPSTGTVNVVGTITCNGGSCSSDLRFKKNVKPLSDCLDRVKNLQGVTFEWNCRKYPERKFPSTMQIGCIAQDVEKFVPEVVYTDEQGYKSIAYDKLSVLLIEAIKEQQQTIDNL